MTLTFIFKISLETFSTKSQARKNENKSVNTKYTKYVHSVNTTLIIIYGPKFEQDIMWITRTLTFEILITMR